VAERKCTHCGGTALEEGFIGENHDSDHVRWFSGPLTKGLFGAIKVKGRRRLNVEAWRCGDCEHLELFAPPMSYVTGPPIHDHH
jgi:hypothetical protein